MLDSTSALLLVTQCCLTLCDPMDCSLPVSSVYGILQARILEWIASSSPGESSWPRDQARVSYIADSYFTTWTTREALHFGFILNSKTTTNQKKKKIKCKKCSTKKTAKRKLVYNRNWSKKESLALFSLSWGHKSDELNFLLLLMCSQNDHKSTVRVNFKVTKKF